VVVAIDDYHRSPRSLYKGRIVGRIVIVEVVAAKQRRGPKALRGLRNHKMRSIDSAGDHLPTHVFESVPYSKAWDNGIDVAHCEAFNNSGDKLGRCQGAGSIVHENMSRSIWRYCQACRDGVATTSSARDPAWYLANHNHVVTSAR